MFQLEHWMLKVIILACAEGVKALGGLLELSLDRLMLNGELLGEE